MSYNVIPTKRFEKEIKRLVKKFHSLKKGYIALIEQLEQNPVMGTSLGGDCYKIRLSIASKGKGKSGGARAITFFIFKENTVYLLTIYDKSEQQDVSDKDLKEMIKNLF